MPEDKKKDDDKTVDTTDKGANDKKDDLLAGKFKSQEDLVAGYKNLEQAFHEKSTEVSKWKGSVEELLSASDGRTREELEGEAEEFSQRFINDPKPVLNEFARVVRKSVLKDVDEYMNARDVVTKFLDANADLKSNPKLFALNLAETDPKTPMADRLATAKEAYDSEIEGIRKTAEERETKRKEFEKKNKAGAVDTGEGAGRDTPKKGSSDDDDSDNDGSFAAYIKERKKERARISSLI